MKHTIVNIPLDVCTKTNIEGFVLTMSLPDKSKSENLKIIIEHTIVNIPLHVCTDDTIEGYVLPMSLPDKSTSEDFKGITETSHC